MVVKQGMTVGKPPLTGVDRRPFKVVDAEGNIIIKCWHKRTGENYIKAIKRNDLTVEPNLTQRLTRRKKPIR